ncbi:MAG: AAA family ATPase [Magnetococcales bacterium]|nr:AAA family ATPase [Magnetococcales bacterium]
MKMISIFNNKGGVGKTTLTFHLAHALALMDKKVLIMDCDPQCNLTIFSMEEEAIHDIWKIEDDYIEDFASAKNNNMGQFKDIINSPRSIHFLLKPTEDGTAELDSVPPPFPLANNLDLIPGRLTLHFFEDKIARFWSEVYQGEPQAIRTVTQIRTLAHWYSQRYGYDYVIIDTSPSLGILNKTIICTVDGFIIPCMPDMFSLYGIRNIGKALSVWKKQFDTIYSLLSENKRNSFPREFVRLLGYTIYNARLYTGTNEWNLARAHYNYAQKMPDTIIAYIDSSIRCKIPEQKMREPIGELAVMHSHNTFPSMAQKYHAPMWELPAKDNLDDSDASTIRVNGRKFKETKNKYIEFAKDLIARI